MTKQDHSDRLNDLLATMTLSEKIGQLNMVSADWAVTGPRLSENYRQSVREGNAGSLLNLWGAEAAHDMQRVAVEQTRLGIPLLLGFDTVHGQHTVFPVPLGEAAAFDPALWQATARAAAEEAAADGLNLVFAPMLDVSRDPRWGRIVEGPGEDAVVAARFGEAKIVGFQTADLTAADSVATTAKHLGAYGAVLAGRDYASVEISDRMLHEVYYPPFQAAIAAGTAAIMPSFNDLAGVPVTANKPLLDDLARGRWGFDGVMISDYNAVTELLAHGVAADRVEAAALALNAGVDIDMMGDAYLLGLPDALERGLVTMAQIDASVLRILKLKAALGLFEDPYRRGRAIPAERRHAIRDLARQAARQSMVLLTNRNKVLPLSPLHRRIAVLGPLADAPGETLGPWAGAGRKDEAISLLAGLINALPDTEILSAPGVGIEEVDTGGIADAIAFAQTADIILLCLGEAAAMSGEAASRAQPVLPTGQRALAEAALALGKPVVVILVSGRPLMVSWLTARADAVLAIWYPGSEAGPALADILTGRHAPSGRLPLSWPVDVGQIPIYFARRPTGRPADPALHYSSKYLDLPFDPLFSFGHGLSYTRFIWRGFSVTPEQFSATETIDIKIEIANDGDRAGTETVFLFGRDPVASVARPVLELLDFAQITLDPGSAAIVRFRLLPQQLSFAGQPPDYAPRLEPGSFEISVGPCADPTRLLNRKVVLGG
jgi:beta-glucosidase